MNWKTQAKNYILVSTNCQLETAQIHLELKKKNLTMGVLRSQEHSWLWCVLRSPPTFTAITLQTESFLALTSNLYEQPLCSFLFQRYQTGWIIAGILSCDLFDVCKIPRYTTSPFKILIWIMPFLIWVTEQTYLYFSIMRNILKFTLKRQSKGTQKFDYVNDR